MEGAPGWRVCLSRSSWSRAPCCIWRHWGRSSPSSSESQPSYTCPQASSMISSSMAQLMLSGIYIMLLLFLLINLYNNITYPKRYFDIDVMFALMMLVGCCYSFVDLIWFLKIQVASSSRISNLQNPMQSKHQICINSGLDASKVRSFLKRKI